ncbi:LPS-assembly protein LptD [Novosphingobium lentum]|uniref:LPS-assembly protein LptD n=1 Tax=Novosphingobium lentum TaxID=145287 RepID=UPI000831A709|nr:LPS assembly protein LptD [Novosphingobium lentum]
MEPPPRRLPQAISRCLRPHSLPGGAAGIALLLICAQPVLARAAPRPAAVQPAPQSKLDLPPGSPAQVSAPSTAPVAPAQATPPSQAAASTAQQGEQIRFEADKLQYLSDAEQVTATGNVVLRREDQTVRADVVTWNRKTGQITANGNIRLVDQDGNVLYTDKVELTDQLKAGAIEDLLLVLRQGGRLAARSGLRDDAGHVVLHNAAYTGCGVEDSNGCPKKPSWEITAVRVTYDPVDKRVKYKGAVLHLFGLPILPLPGLGHTTDFRGETGLLIPDFRLSASNGGELNETYYVRLSDRRDLAVTGYVYTEALPMVSAKFRALTDRGAYQITGWATRSGRIPLSNGTLLSQNDFRGALDINGRLQLSEHWSLSGSGRVASDRTFLRRYDISRDDRLRSAINLERIDQDSYFSLAAWVTQTLRSGDSQGLVPIALPALDYRRRLAVPGIGGKLTLEVNSLAITRTEGQDSQRAFGKAQWDLRTVTGMGQVVTLTGLLRGDVYHSDQNGFTTVAAYRGNPGWQTRGIATAAVDVTWPLIGKAFGGTHVLTPHVQLVASPPIRNLAIPNEDSRAVDLEDSNLFELNRFPGYDRVEGGARVTYGVDWQLNRPGLKVLATVGQSYRLSTQNSLLPDGTGLAARTSDIVGRAEVRFRDIVKLTTRFRLDKDNLTVRRSEIDATIGNHKTYIEAGYLYLNRNIDPTLEDLQDREELRLAGRVAFARYWSVFGSAIMDLTNNTINPGLKTDGFQMLRSRAGFAYTDDCLDLSFTWRRDYVTTGDATKGNTFQISLALRNLGVR